MSNNTTYKFPANFLWGTSLPVFTRIEDLSNTNWNNLISANFIQENENNLSSFKWQDLLEKLPSANIKTVIFPIDWAKVQPTKDFWNEKKIDQYRDQLRILNERKIIPMISLFDISEPSWFLEQGGWVNKESIQSYLNYCEKIVQSLQAYTCLWITFREINRYLFSVYWFNFFQTEENSLKNYLRAKNNLFLAHKKAYNVIKDKQTEAQVTISYQYIHLASQTKLNPIEWFSQFFYQKIYNPLIFNNLKTNGLLSIFKKFNTDTIDFFLISYSGDQATNLKMVNPENLYSIFRLKGFNKLLYKIALYQKKIFLEAQFSTDCPNEYPIEYFHKLWHFSNLNPYLEGIFFQSTVHGINFNLQSETSQCLFETKPNIQLSKIGKLLQTIYQENVISYPFVKENAPIILPKIFP